MHETQLGQCALPAPARSSVRASNSGLSTRPVAGGRFSGGAQRAMRSPSGEAAGEAKNALHMRLRLPGRLPFGSGMAGEEAHDRGLIGGGKKQGAAHPRDQGP